MGRVGLVETNGEGTGEQLLPVNNGARKASINTPDLCASYSSLVSNLLQTLLELHNLENRERDGRPIPKAANIATKINTSAFIVSSQDRSGSAVIK